MDNVIILGAGASADAGIPMLRNFVEKMIDIAQRNSWDGKPLSAHDSEIFRKVKNIKSSIDSYLSRVNFNPENLEDILSILAFNGLAGDRKSNKDFQDLTTAISRTIDLCCTIQHDGSLDSFKPEGAGAYQEFWNAIFLLMKNGKPIPTIITLNYDLTLERALLHAAIGPSKDPLPFSGIKINNHHSKSKEHCYKALISTFRSGGIRQNGNILIECTPNELSVNTLEIDYLKLHGSLNFSVDENQRQLVKPAQSPIISPPIFNKHNDSKSEKCWKVAISKLREAKNIVIVGYSLPKTDIYMEYFFKSAIGPNINLRKITVFDPAYDADFESLKSRYKSCLSENMAHKLDFKRDGFYRFTELLKNSPESILFI